MAKREPKSAFDRLPKRVKGVILTARREGLKVCKFLRHKETGETETNFFFEPGGRRIGPATAKRAIESGFLVPNNDGLFAGTDQTWTAAP